MRINTNIAALTAQRNLSLTETSLQKSMEKLSSGFRINSASDDAAGLAISNKLGATVQSLTQASRNADQANSVMQIMQGGASQIESILQRMKELATQSNSSTVDTAAQTQLNNEFTSLKNEIDRITGTTQFNGNNLLDGSFGSSVDTATGAGHSTLLAAGMGVYGADINGAAAGTYTVTDVTGAGSQLKITDSVSGTSQVVDVSAGAQDVNFSKFGITLHTTADFAVNSDGAAGNTKASGDVVVAGAGSGSFMVSSSGNYGSKDLLTMSAVNLTTTGLGVNASTISSATTAQAALTAIDTALNTVNTQLGTIGALQNRIDFANQNTKSLILNTQAAVSTIKDVDMASEMTNFSKNQILQQAGTAILAQANQSAQSVLKLLG